MKNSEKNLLELENILTFLGINFIDYKGHRTSNGHKTAKNTGQINAFFGKDVMTAGQFIEDINWWDFSNSWNDLIFLVEKIEEIPTSFDKNSFEFDVVIQHHSCIIKSQTEGEEFIHMGGFNSKKEAVYSAVIEFIQWYNQQNQ